VRRLLVGLVALVAALSGAPAAFADAYVVNDNGDAQDFDTTVPACDTDVDPSNGFQCTLRAAIEQADATTGADTISFAPTGQAPAPIASLPPISEQLSIDGGGAVTVTFGPAVTGPLLDVQASTTLLKAITLTGGASGPVVNFAGSGDRLDTVTVKNAPGPGVTIVGSSARVDGSKFDTVAGTAIVASGSGATIASTTITNPRDRGIDISGSSVAVDVPDISGAGSDGIRVTGNGATITNGRIRSNAGNGVVFAGQNSTVTHTTFLANGGKPIANAPGANGGVTPPQNLRIGPRRADGSLPLSGTASGSVELWSGNPATATAPSYFIAINATGDFTYNFGAEPPPGSVFSATLTTPGLGTSEFETITVPSDVVSPDVSFARALDTSNVRVDFNEPLDPASVQKEDFKLTMAGAERVVTATAVDPEGRSVVLASSGWKAGEAGYVDLTAPGVVTDTTGNAILSAPRLRVAAAPGDFVAPLGGQLSVSPTSICLTRGKHCRTSGMTIKFVATEPGKATLLIKRSNKTVGKRLYGNIVAGANTLKFNGRLGSRKLRAGRYRLLMYVQDPVGNVTDQPPIVLFTVRRVTP
jgi:hypothetical protein